MPRVTCSFCGLPFSVRAVQEGASYYCCSGCALASRIPMSDGHLPVSRALVVALVLGFGLFNEILFATLALAVAGEGRGDVAEKLAFVSLGVGAVLLAACTGFVVTSPARRWTDGAALVPALFLAAWSGWRAVAAGVPAAIWTALAANVVLAAWLARGWLRRAIVRRGKRRETPAQ